MIPFYPSRSDNQVVTPAAASSSVAINKSTPSVRFANSGLKICYVKIGIGAQVATSADIPVMPGESIVIGKGYDDDTCAFISPEGTTLNIQTGTGGVFNYTPSAGELGSIDLVNMTNELAKAEESTEAPNHWLVFKDGLLKRLTNASLDGIADGTTYKRVLAAIATALNASTIVAGTQWGSGNDGNGGQPPAPKPRDSYGNIGDVSYVVDTLPATGQFMVIAFKGGAIYAATAGIAGGTNMNTHWSTTNIDRVVYWRTA